MGESIHRHPFVESAAGEAFFLGGTGYSAVHDDRTGRVVIEGGNAGNDHVEIGSPPTGPRRRSAEMWQGAGLEAVPLCSELGKQVQGPPHESCQLVLIRMLRYASGNLAEFVLEQIVVHLLALANGF